MSASAGFDVASGTNLVNDYRTSTNVFLPRQSNVVIANVEQRIADMTGYPWVNGEDLQVVKYMKASTTNRIMTIIIQVMKVRGWYYKGVDSALLPLLCI